MSISILRVKDAEGNIIEIPAIKGDKGDAYILTEADKEEISNMAKPDIDQTYSPESENAQSGKAVAEAISTKANLQMTELNADEFYYIGGVEPLEGTHIYEVVDKLSGGAVCFTGGLTLYTDVDTKIGCKYLITAHLDAEAGWQFTSIIELVDLADKVNTSDVQQNYDPAGVNANKPVSAVAVSEAIVDMVTVNDVDKEFNPESDNPQSGKAVAAALVENWVKIADDILEQDSIPVYSRDTNGNPFNVKKFMIVVFHKAKEGDTTKEPLWLYIENGSSYQLAGNTSSYAKNIDSTHKLCGELWQNWRVIGAAASAHYTTNNQSYYGIECIYGCRPEILGYKKPINSLRLTYGTSGTLNAGSRIEIWGLNA